MAVLKFKRFTRTGLLRRIGRPLLIRFFERFQPELCSESIALPSTDLPEQEWAAAVARLLSAPEKLPAGLSEALYAIDEMATAEGQEQLETALAQAGLELDYEPRGSREDLALQVWLAAPAVLARVHNRQRLLRLTAFEYFGTPARPEPRETCAEPQEQTLRELTTLLDAWFVRHQRGYNTCQIELHRFADHQNGSPGPEFWFLVRHGDTYSRAPKVEEQTTEILHFRPQRDDVVVYSPQRDELRINARTRGERDLYVRVFGRCLRGSEDYFSVRNTYSLEPLREHGADVLLTDDLPGLAKITLRALETVEAGTDQVVTREAKDLFQRFDHGGDELIPREGRIARADFDVHFEGCLRPRPIQIRLPNVLKLRRHCDLHLLEPWLCRFRVNSA